MADSLETLTCPACGKEMKKIFIQEANFNLDICIDGCGGILFNNREFNKFDEAHEDINEILKTYIGKVYEEIDTSSTRQCPCCNSNMVKNYTSDKREVQIDECYNCGAKFLDFGELQRIRNEYASKDERMEDFDKAFEREFSAELLEADINSKEALSRKNWLHSFLADYFSN